MNPDSAVAIDSKRETQPFRSEVDGYLPLTGHRSTVLGQHTEPHTNDVGECKNDFETSQSDAFAAPGFRLASDIFGFNCGIRVEGAQAVKRALVGAVWGMILYLLIYNIAGAILGSAATESWRPTVALVAAALAAAGSWKGWLPGTRNSRDPSETKSFD